MKERILAALVLLAGLALQAAAQGAAAPAASGPQRLQTVNLSEIRQFDPKDILKKVPLDTDKLVFNVYFLQPRQLLRLHRHPASDELFYVVEGLGQFTVGGNQVKVSSGSAVYGPAGTDHGIVNSGKDNMVVLSIQGPKPVTIKYAENSTISCPVCEQEDIIPAGAKDGDVFICPRCQSKLRLSRDENGKWTATQL